MSDCPHCRELERKVEFLSDLCNKKDAEIVGMQHEKLKDTREKIALRGALTKKRRQEDVNRHVMAVARMWRALCSPTASIKETGRNVEHIRCAFVNYCKGDNDAKRHLLYDAIRGAALRPYDAGYGERTANPLLGGVKRTRRCNAEHVFASETRIEALAGYYRMVQAKPVEWKHAVWRAAAANERLWQSLWFVEAQYGHDRDAYAPLSPRLHRAQRDYGVDGVQPPESMAAHLFIEEAAQEESVEAPQGGRPQLRLIEGEAA